MSSKRQRKTKTVKGWVMDKYHIRTNDNIYQVLDTGPLPREKSTWMLLQQVDFCNWRVLDWIPV